MATKLPRISVSVEDDLLRYLNRLQYETRHSRSQVVRDILWQYFKEQEYAEERKDFS